MNAFRSVFLLAFLVFFKFGFSQKMEPPNFIWRASDASRDIRGETFFFEDSTFEMTAAEVLQQPFRAFPMERKWMNKFSNNHRKRIWLLFSIDGADCPSDQNLIFFAGIRAQITGFEVSERHELKPLGKGGFWQKSPNVEWLKNSLGLGLTIPKGQKRMFLVGCRDQLQLYDEYKSELFSSEGFDKKIESERSSKMPYLIFFGFLTGCLTLLAVLGLLQFLQNHDTAFFWYAVYLSLSLSLLLKFFAIDLRQPRFLGISLEFVFSAAPILLSFISAAYIQFMRSFLGLDQSNGRLSMIAKKLFRATCFFAAINVGIFFWPERPFFYQNYIASFFWMFGVGVFFIAVLAKSRNPLARYAVFGTTFLTVLPAFVVLKNAKPGLEASLFDTSMFWNSLGLLLESLCFALGLGEKSRLWSLEKQQAEQKLSSLRTVVAQDLHDDLGSEMSSVSLAAFAAARSGDSIRMAAELEKVAAQSSKMVDEMRDIVWALSPENNSTERLAERMRAFSARLFDDQNVELHFDFSSETTGLKMEPEARKQLYLFFKEAATNAARHASAKNVFVKMGVEKGHFLLEIRDDGAGFDKNEPTKSLGGNGLLNLEKRANALGGRLEIEAEKGAGAAIRLII